VGGERDQVVPQTEYTVSQRKKRNVSARSLHRAANIREMPFLGHDQGNRFGFLICFPQTWTIPQQGLQANGAEGRGGRLTKKFLKNPARAGWPRRLALVRATSRAEVDVIGPQLCSCAPAIFPSLALS